MRVGQVLHETYRVTRLIAAGGMGIVFEAEHVRLSRKKFAVKVLHPSVVEDPAAYVRFQREAEIVSGLGHPHIIFVSDFNELDSGQPYLVMELLEGEDLKRRLRSNGPLPPPQVVQVMEQTASALQVAHDKGIIHRDLKPGNIFLVDNPGDELRVKLLDFGISKIRHSKSGVTEDLTLLGTPFYMAPEQAEGEISDIDHRTDIFSLGTIAYLALSGKLPFEAPTTPGVLFKVCYQEPKPITELMPEMPESLHHVISRALSKSKTDRYQRAEDFSTDLKDALASVLPGAPRFAPRTVQDLTPPSAEQLRAFDDDGSGELSGEVSGEVSGETSGLSAATGLEAMDTSQDSIMGALGAAPGGPAEPVPEENSEGELALLPPDTAEVSLSDVEEVVEEPPTDQVDIPAALQAAPGEDMLQEDSIRSSTISAAVGEKSLVEPLPRKRFPILLAGGAGVTLAACAAIVLLVIYSGWQEGEVPRGASPVEVEAAAGEVEDAPAHSEERDRPAPRPRTIAVKLQVSPPGATITLDGKRREDNPLVLEPSPREHVLRVEAEGHEPLEHSFVARVDDTIVVTLNKRSAPPRPAAKAGPARAASKTPPPAASRPPAVNPGATARPTSRPVTRKAARPAPRPRPVKKKKPVWIYDDL